MPMEAERTSRNTRITVPLTRYPVRVAYVRSMRTALRCHMLRRALSGAAFAMAVLAHAQGDKGSLTEQFPNMNAKERARIAAKENEEAQKDATYQDVMQRAERSFQEGRYEEAIKQYEEARAMRPYNVYPKVKIEDLRALLARQAAKPDTSVAEEHPVDTDTVVPAKVPMRVPAGPAPEPVKEPDAVVKPKTAPLPEPVVQRTAPPVVASSSEKPAQGIIEQRYREGHAFVIERAVTIDGRLVKYKRVYHPYGQVFYFEDGLAVDERVWKARFPDQ